jgi:hypothetical protein
MATNSQPIGTPVDPRSPDANEHAVEPSGPRGDNPSTAGPGPTSVRSNTPENAEGRIQPSPEDSNVTPGTTPEK